MKKMTLAVSALMLAAGAFAQDAKTIQLKQPQLKKGLPVMQALNERKSVREFDAKELDLQTLSNLVWAATGVNRPDGRRTNPTAMNKQEIDIYACLKDGAYFYNFTNHTLEFVTDKDCRQNNAPVTLLIVADTAKTTERWANVDAGIASQNISLFCAGMGLATVARGQMPADEFKKALNLEDGKAIVLNHPVGYPKTKK